MANEKKKINTINGNETPLWIIKTSKFLMSNVFKGPKLLKAPT